MNEADICYQVFPPLIEVFPEARLNLIIYYLKNEDYNEAYELIKDIEPLILKKLALYINPLFTNQIYPKRIHNKRSGPCCFGIIK